MGVILEVAWKLKGGNRLTLCFSSVRVGDKGFCLRIVWPSIDLRVLLVSLLPQPLEHLLQSLPLLCFHYSLKYTFFVKVFLKIHSTEISRCLFIILHTSNEILLHVFGTCVYDKIVVFRNVTPCGLVGGYRRFGGTYCILLRGQVGLGIVFVIWATRNWAACNFGRLPRPNRVVLEPSHVLAPDVIANYKEAVMRHKKVGSRNEPCPNQRENTDENVPYAGHIGLSSQIRVTVLQ